MFVTEISFVVYFNQILRDNQRNRYPGVKAHLEKILFF